MKAVDAVTDVNSSGITDAGDTISYSFTVTNTGNVPVHDIALVDPLLTGQLITTSCVPSSLAPGEVSHCTQSGPYVVTGADELAGTVANRATATGTDRTRTR